MKGKEFTYVLVSVATLALTFALLLVGRFLPIWSSQPKMFVTAMVGLPAISALSGVASLFQRRFKIVAIVCILLSLLFIFAVVSGIRAL